MPLMRDILLFFIFSLSFRYVINNHVKRVIRSNSCDYKQEHQNIVYIATENASVHNRSVKYEQVAYTQ